MSSPEPRNLNQVSDPTYAKAVVPLAMGANAGFQFKTHPNINKPLFSSSSALGLKDAARGFPTNSAVGVLKWRQVTTDESLVPLVVNCWPTQTGGDSYEVTVEYELSSSYPSLEIRNLVVQVPAPVDSVPSIVPSIGQANFSKREAAVTWEVSGQSLLCAFHPHPMSTLALALALNLTLALPPQVPIIDSGSSSGTVEFHCTGMGSADSLFPIQVSFSATSTLCDLQVKEVKAADDSNAPYPFGASSSLVVESYTIS